MHPCAAQHSCQLEDETLSTGLVFCGGKSCRAGAMQFSQDVEVAATSPRRQIGRCRAQHCQMLHKAAYQTLNLILT